jgi:hypothetical protein
MSIRIFSTNGGTVVLPDRTTVLLDRQNGGNLVVLPVRTVWERGELSSNELTNFSFLVAATAKAMLEVLLQLKDGCINYWEAGNWALNDQAEPAGRKKAKEFRKMHLHLLGRSPGSTDPRWVWGESPDFPRFIDRHTYSQAYERLRSDECRNVIAQAEIILKSKYAVPSSEIASWSLCSNCNYPTISAPLCDECGSS